MKADQCETRTEPRCLGGYPHVASERKTEACSGASAIYCCNDRLGQCPHRTGNLLSFGKDCAKTLLIFGFTKILQLLDITARRESPALARHHENADTIVGRDDIQRVEDLITH